MYFIFVKERNISERHSVSIIRKYMKNILFGPFGAADIFIRTKQEREEREISVNSAVQ